MLSSNNYVIIGEEMNKLEKYINELLGIQLATKTLNKTLKKTLPYPKHIFPNGFKAQVLATSQKAAVRYAKSLNPENFHKFENKMMRNILIHSIR